MAQMTKGLGMGSQVYYDTNKGQYYTQRMARSSEMGDENTYMGTGVWSIPKIRTYLGAPTSLGNYQQQYGQPTQYTPNQATAIQLNGFGQMAAPQWMMDAYINKISGMGGNANPPVPFPVTPGGFGNFTNPVTPATPTTPQPPNGQMLSDRMAGKGVQPKVGPATGGKGSNPQAIYNGFIGLGGYRSHNSAPTGGQ